VVKPWNSSPKKSVQSSSLEIFKNHLEIALGGPAQAEGLKQMTSRDLLQSHPFCDSVIL